MKATTLCAISFLLCLMLSGVTYATDNMPNAKVLYSNGCHCVTARSLAEWAGGTIDVSPDDAYTYRLTIAGKSLAVSAGWILAASDNQVVTLPTCPAIVADECYVPTRAVVEFFGGTLESAGGNLLVRLQDKVAYLSMPTQAAKDARGSFLADLNDPRVPLGALDARYQKKSELRDEIDAFNTVAVPMQPHLDAIANSRVLKLLAHLPLVGGVISTAQDASGACSDAIGAGRKAADLDEQYSAPLRRAIAATIKVQQSPDAATVHVTRKLWQDSVLSLDNQMTLNHNTVQYLTTFAGLLAALETKAGAYNQTHPNSRMDLNTKELITSIEQLKVVLNADLWQRQTLKAYFETLLQDTRGM